MSIWHLAKAVTLVVACLAVPAASLQQCPRTRIARALAAKPVDQFQFHGIGAVDALLTLGRQERIPLAIESVDVAFTTRPVDIDVKRVTAGALLTIILSGSKGYRWDLRNGVVHVLNPFQPPTHGNLLDRKIPTYAIQRMLLADADILLRASLEHVLQPQLGGGICGGIVGDYPGGNPHRFIGPLALHDATVRRILDALATGPPPAAWVVLVPPRFLNQLPSTGLWKIVPYDDPGLLYMGDLVRQSVSEYPGQPAASRSQSRAR
jgi:hypothetical protein